MITLEGYDLYSFLIGAKHCRSFTFDDVGGLIADYALGECGASDSPVTEDYFNSISRGTGGLEILGDQGHQRLVVNRDRVVMSKRTHELGDSLASHEAIKTNAQHLFPGIYALLKKPNLVFVGMVWEFTKTSTKSCERFRHPAADHISSRLINLNTNNNEYPTEAAVQFAFRKRLPSSVIQKNQDDYLSVNLNLRNARVADLWPPEHPEPDNVKKDRPTVSTISVDIQRVFDPRRPLRTDDIANHWKLCNDTVLSRAMELLSEAGFGQKEEK